MSSPLFTRRPCQKIPFASHRCRLALCAGPVFDRVVVEGYQRLALRRRDQRQITQQLVAARAALMVPSSPIGRRFAATVLNVALADLVCESAR